MFVCFTLNAIGKGNYKEPVRIYKKSMGIPRGSKKGIVGIPMDSNKGMIGIPRDS